MLGVSFELSFGTGMGSYDDAFDGILEGSTLGVSLLSTDSEVIGFGEDIILGSAAG